MTYSDQLKDPRWQRMRLQVLDLHRWQCDTCDRDNKTLEVHHKFYCLEPNGNFLRKAAPWDYTFDDFRVLCDDCHEQTEIALMELRRVFGGLDYFHIAAFAQDFEKACEADNTLSVMEVLAFNLATVCK